MGWDVVERSGVTYTAYVMPCCETSGVKTWNRQHVQQRAIEAKISSRFASRGNCTERRYSLKASTINHMPELLLHMLTSDEFQSQCVQDEILGAALPWMCDLLFPGFCIAEIAKFTKHNELYLGLTRPEVAVWATFLSRDRRNRNPSVRTATPQRLSRTTTTVANSNPQPLHATPSSPNPGTGQELTGDPKGLGGGQPAAATEHENESHSNPWI